MHVEKVSENNPDRLQLYRPDQYVQFLMVFLAQRIAAFSEAIPSTEKQRLCALVLQNFAQNVVNWNEALALLRHNDDIDAENLHKLVFGEIDELSVAQAEYMQVKSRPAVDGQAEAHALFEAYAESLDVVVLLVSQALALSYHHDWGSLFAEGMQFETGVRVVDIMSAYTRYREHPSPLLHQQVIRLVAGYIFGLNSGNPQDLLTAADFVLTKISQDKTKSHFQPAAQHETKFSLTEEAQLVKYTHGMQALRLIRNFFQYGSFEKQHDAMTMPGYRYLLEPFMVTPFTVLLENFDDSKMSQERLHMALQHYEIFMREICDRQMRLPADSKQPRLPKKILAALVGWFMVRDFRQTSGTKPLARPVESQPLELTEPEWRQLNVIMHSQLIPQFWQRHPDLNPARKGLQPARR